MRRPSPRARALVPGPVVSVVSIVSLVFGSGCSGPQRLLAPAGPGAGELAWLTWVLLAGVLIPTAVTLVLFGMALWRGLGRGRRERAASEEAIAEDVLLGAPEPREERWLVWVGAVIALVLFGLLGVNIRTSGRVMRPPEAPTVEVEVTARQFWWSFAYPQHGVVTANELVLPAGESVRVVLSSGDVIHSFWVPELHGKRDATPGHVQTFWVKADRPGDYRGQCAEFCGMQHALMAFFVRAVPREEFDRWIAQQQAPASSGITRGAEVFRQGGCVHCHVVRGVFPETVETQTETQTETGAEADAAMQAQVPGPDLTHLASRRTIAAASTPLTREALRAFILDPHVLKPGLRMPPTAVPEAELDALLDWLLSLE